MKPNHPNADTLTLADISPGTVYELPWCFSEEDVNLFARLSGDYSPLHVDADYARQTEFGQQVVHGMLLASLFSQLVGMKVPGKNALYLGQELVFRKAVFIDEPLMVRAKVVAKHIGTATLSLMTEIRNSDNKVVVSGTAKVKVRDEADEEAPDGQVVAENSTEGSKEGPVAIITGGSRGIGAQVAKILAHRGYHCVIIYHRGERDAQALCREVRGQGGQVTALQADLGDSCAVKGLVEQIAARFDQVSALVNGAIGRLDTAPVMELGWEHFEHYFSTQVKGVLELSQGLYPLMKRSGHSAIVNILSQVVNNVPPVGMAPYVTAKYALLGLSKALATEWAEDGIRVNMVSPGLARTELTQHYHDKVFRMEQMKTPLGRLVEVEDIANTIAYLLGSQSHFMTGMNLYLTGGQDMR